MKPSICFVNFNAYCLFNPESGAPMGGAELEIYSLAKHFAKEGYATVLVTGDWGQPYVEEREGVRILRSVKLGARNYHAQLAGFWKTLHASKADVFLSTGAGLEVGLVAAYCKLKKKAYIYRTAHDLDCDGRFIRENPIAGRLYKYGLEHAVRIVTSVTQHRELLARHHPRLRNRVSHINLALELPRKEEGKKSSVLWVSRCETWKRPGLFLDLAEALPEHPFVMICPAQKHRPRLFEEIKKRAALLPNVEFHDYIPFNKIQPYFQQAKVFVNTSEAEGFTYTLIQSGAVGTPVAYLAINPNEVITREGVGFWAAGDFQVLVQQVGTLMEDEEEWQKKSAAIHGYVRKNHGIEEVGRQWERLLQEI